ncbi:2-phosphosulfolactate phosphatase, partial [candidate division KSB1 bacterium]|nr:2-phosphosulfolactate phosphatase [candidate division KSB1 bacterium]
GFDLGNSPAEYTADRIGGKTVILSTTNGTRALARAESAVSILVLALTNLSAVCDALLAQNRPVAVLCSGRNGDFSLEDTVCAGLLAEKLVAASNAGELNPGAEQAVELARAHKSNLLGMLRSTPHGQYLQSIGFGLDLEYCARLNASTLAPVLRDGSIVLPSTLAV